MCKQECVCHINLKDDGVTAPMWLKNQLLQIYNIFRWVKLQLAMKQQAALLPSKRHHASLSVHYLSFKCDGLHQMWQISFDPLLCNMTTTNVNIVDNNKRCTMPHHLFIWCFLSDTLTKQSTTSGSLWRPDTVGCYIYFKWLICCWTDNWGWTDILAK